MSRVLVQPYAAYKGHFAQYTSNLRQAFDTEVRSTRVRHAVDGSLDVPSPTDWKAFLRWKVVHALDAYRQVPFHAEVLHIVDFEPVAAVLTLARIISARKLIVTLHAVTAATSHRQTMRLGAQAHKALTLTMLRFLLATGRAKVVVHYEVQRTALVDAGFPAAHVHTVPYPTTRFDTRRDELKRGNLLVFGNLRVDKDPLAILRAVSRTDLRITLAGRIDPALAEEVGKLGFTIIDRHVSEQELVGLFSEAEYVLLPYGPRYTGGAGPMKDAIGSGRPVIAPNFPLFREIVCGADVGLLFDQPDDIEAMVRNVPAPMYERMVTNTEKYRQTYTWEYMRRAYERLYAN